jgi:hypothetical protein
MVAWPPATGSREACDMGERHASPGGATGDQDTQRPATWVRAMRVVWSPSRSLP